MASESSNAHTKPDENTNRAAAKSLSSGVPAVVYVIGVLAILGIGVWAYLQYLSKQNSNDLALTPEAKAYVHDLRLTDVEMKGTETYLKQTIVEIDGKIGNAGARALEVVEIYCLFHDTYGQLVLRRRLPIVSPRMGGLKPGESKSFRLPFDDLPESWNNVMPQLVIAGVKFS